MIHIDVQDDLKKLTKQLDGVAYKAPTVLKDAANATGKYAMRQMKKTSEKRYDYQKEEARLSLHLKRKSATYANPFSVITAEGAMNPIVSFHVTPMRLAHGSARPGAYAAHVLNGKSDEAIQEGKGKSKAFLVKFRSGHVALMRRVYGKTYENPAERKKKKLDTTKIEEVKTVSPVHMGSKVYDLEEEAIGDKLVHYTKMYIDKFMKARASV